MNISKIKEFEEGKMYIGTENDMEKELVKTMQSIEAKAEQSGSVELCPYSTYWWAQYQTTVRARQEAAQTGGVGGEDMKEYRSKKTTRIAWELGKIQAVFPENEIVKKFAEAMMEEAELYDGFLKSWDNPHEEFSEEEVVMGKCGSNAGLDVINDVVNRLRMLFVSSSGAA